MNTIPKPVFLEPCDPWQRTFPEGWKAAYWGRAGGTTEEGYECPMCHKRFRGNAGFRQLHGDHIIAYSFYEKGLKEGAPTVWENFQLLCGPDNYLKDNLPL